MDTTTNAFPAGDVPTNPDDPNVPVGCGDPDPQQHAGDDLEEHDLDPAFETAIACYEPDTSPDNADPDPDKNADNEPDKNPDSSPDNDRPPAGDA